MSHNMYLESEVMSATPAKLVIMLYDGAINFLKRLDNIDYSRDIELKTYNINKAYAIISELLITLNMEHKAISEPLFALYTYMQSRLVEANMQNNSEYVREVIRLLTGLRESWGQIITIEMQKVGQSHSQAIGATSEFSDDEDREVFSLAC